MTDAGSGASPQAIGPLDPLQTPGHFVRRCHQISVALFLEEFRDTGLTPVQFAALAAIARHPGLSQSDLVDMIAVDRSTIGMILRSLEKRALISRVTPDDNRRVRQLYLRPEGRVLLRKTPECVARATRRLLAPLTPEESDAFVRLLSRLVDANNEFSRSPLREAKEA